MWIARDMYGSLNLFEDKPDRCDKVEGNFPGDKTFNIHPCTWRIKNPYGGFNISGFVKINKELFPNLKWEDEPVEVFVNRES